VTGEPSPQFSIVTPVYNRPDTIGRCIESVLRQNDPGAEHIVVNDGSSEPTREAIRPWLSQSSVKLVDLDGNHGVNYARNRGIETASKDFVIFLDSDDMLTDQALAIIRGSILEHPGYLHYLFVPSDRARELADHARLASNTAEIHYEDWLSERITGDFIHVMNRDYLAREPFTEEFRIYEGTTFLRLFRTSQKQLFVHKTVAQRDRGRSDSVSDEYWLTGFDRIQNEYRRIGVLLSGFREDLARVDPAGLQALDRKSRWLGLVLKGGPGGWVLGACIIARSRARRWLARLRR
jgi:glycosyltransferase involved in cell wall biosynthesis